MAKYSDAFHPEHAKHTGEDPTTGIDIGPAGLQVTLDAWGPQEHLFTTLCDTLMSNWGEAPTRTRNQDCRYHLDSILQNHYKLAPEEERHFNEWEHKTGWCRLTDPQRAFIENAFAGKSLQQDLEGISLWFTVNGVTRAFTHEFVRTRLGAAFKQHGGRDNDWRHRRWTMTEAMERTCFAQETVATEWASHGKRHPVLDWGPIDHYLAVLEDFDGNKRSLRSAITDHLDNAKQLYAALVDAGVPWQDARRVLPIGCQTYVHGIYNWIGFKGAAANRLEFVMDWEINCVFQLMLREIKMKCPPFMSAHLGSHSDIAGRAMFDQMESWPPDGKYPSMTLRCGQCGHSEANHRDARMDDRIRIPNERICDVCQRDGCWTGAEPFRHGRAFVPPLHVFVAEDTVPRSHRREQMPFFVLSPDSMNGGPIQWLWTNGHYHDIDLQLKKG